MKLIGKIINFFLLFIVLAAIFHNFTAKTALAFGLGHVLGTAVHVDSADVDFRGTHVTFRGVRIDHPRGFPHGTMMDIPLIFADLEISALLGRKIHVETVEVQLREVNVIRDSKRRINLLFLKIFEDGQSSSSQPSQQGQVMPLQIDQLIFSAGQIVYKDTAGGRSTQRVIKMNLDRVSYRNVGSVSGIMEVVIWEVLKQAGLGSLQNAAAGLLGKIFSGKTS